MRDADGRVTSEVSWQVCFACQSSIKTERQEGSDDIKAALNSATWTTSTFHKAFAFLSGINFPFYFSLFLAFIPCWLCFLTLPADFDAICLQRKPSNKEGPTVSLCFFYDLLLFSVRFYLQTSIRFKMTIISLRAAEIFLTIGVSVWADLGLSAAVGLNEGLNMACWLFAAQPGLPLSLSSVYLNVSRGRKTKWCRNAEQRGGELQDWGAEDKNFLCVCQFVHQLWYLSWLAVEINREKITQISPWL